jgi:hypothetical protein
MANGLNTDTLINGNRFSWTSISVLFTSASPTPNIPGIPLGDQSVGPFKDISYNDKQENNKVWGTGTRPIGKVRGHNDASFSFSMYRGEWNEFVAALYLSKATNGGSPFSGLLDIDFSMQVQYSENGIDVSTDKIIGCRLTEFDITNSDGSTDAAVVKCSGTAMYIMYNQLLPGSAPAFPPFNP